MCRRTADSGRAWSRHPAGVPARRDAGPAKGAVREQPAFRACAIGRHHAESRLRSQLPGWQSCLSGGERHILSKRKRVHDHLWPRSPAKHRMRLTVVRADACAKAVAVAIGSITVAASLGVLGMPQLYTVAFLAGALTIFYVPDSRHLHPA